MENRKQKYAISVFNPKIRRLVPTQMTAQQMIKLSKDHLILNFYNKPFNPKELL